MIKVGTAMLMVSALSQINCNIIFGSDNTIDGQNNIKIGFGSNIDGSNNWIVGVGHNVQGNGVMMFGPDADPRFYSPSTSPGGSLNVDNAATILSNIQNRLQSNAKINWGW